jgi:Na+/proline symporter
MMQKNISVDNLKNSKKNMLTFAGTLLLVNLAFLFLGGLLYLLHYNMEQNMEQQVQILCNIFGFKDASGNIKNIMGDDLFLHYLLTAISMMISVIFIIGLISALFPSADGALTAVTSSYCVDLLNLMKIKPKLKKKKKTCV